MTRPVLFAIPGELSAPTGGYEYARQVLRALPGLTYLPLPGAFPFPAEADLADAAAQLAAVPRQAVLLIDGLALGAMPRACLDAVRAPIVALVHHPLFLETGLAAADRVALRASEQAALSLAAHVITTSASTAALLSQVFGIPLQRTSIAEPGTEPAARSVGKGDPPRLLAVGAVVPRKGYDLLVAALAELADLPWILTIAGALDRDAAAAARLRAAIAAAGLSKRIVLAGAVDRVVLQRLYAAADIFVIASRYEGYGMAAAEAMACGLPIVATTGGALAATIPDTAGLKVAPGNAAGLRGALRRMLTDSFTRAACSEASWAAGRLLPRWKDTARRIVEVCNEAVISSK